MLLHKPYLRFRLDCVSMIQDRRRSRIPWHKTCTTMAKRNLRSCHVQPRITIEDEQGDITILAVNFGVDCEPQFIVLPSLV